MGSQMRDEFVAAYRVALIKTDLNVQKRHFEMRGGEFVDRTTSIAWWAWQASRQAVEIELPDTVANTGTLTSGAVLSYKRECRKVLEAQGLKVKS